MDLDLFDETYPMGKSNLPFKDFGQGGLTGVEGGLTGLAQTCHFWVLTIVVSKHAAAPHKYSEHLKYTYYNVVQQKHGIMSTWK
jgi:hypothetical protein